METSLIALPVPETLAKTGNLYQLQSLDRAVAVLEMLGESETALSLAEVCQRLRLLNEKRQAIAAVSVSGPASRITAPTMPEIAEHLLRCCRDISFSLGVHAKKRPRALSAFERHYHS
jgi:hypothetical protein